MRRLYRMNVIFLLVIALLAPVEGIAKKKNLPANKDPSKIGERNVGKGLNFYSIEKEIAMGKRLAQQVERQAKLIHDPVITEYVNRVGQNLVRNSDVKIPVTIKVIDSDEVNAFALPGGFMFVNTGLILKADTEAELAGARLDYQKKRYEVRQGALEEMVIKHLLKAEAAVRKLPNADALVEDGTIMPGGKLLVNPCGGLIYCGHAVGASNIMSAWSARRELVNRGLKRAAVHGTGSTVAQYGVAFVFENDAA